MRRGCIIKCVSKDGLFFKGDLMNSYKAARGPLNYVNCSFLNNSMCIIFNSFHILAIFFGGSLLH